MDAPQHTGLALKGQLVPSGPFRIERLPLSAELAEVARQVWIPRWELPDGMVQHQPVLSYPGVNVVVEHREHGVHFPVVGLGSRELSGTGWAAGVLLRPGAGHLLVAQDHSALIGRVLPIPNGDDLVAAIRDVMSDRVADASGERVVEIYQGWLAALVEHLDDDALLLNHLCDAVETDPTIRSTADLVERFDRSERSLQRLVRRRVGLSPRWLIQRRRLQDAAERLRTEPEVSLAAVAIDLGYSDQAHFTREFGAVIGETPGAYRSRVGCSPR